MEIEPKYGWPIEPIVRADLAKSTQKLKLSLCTRRYGKWITIVSGLDNDIYVKARA